MRGHVKFSPVKKGLLPFFCSCILYKTIYVYHKGTQLLSHLVMNPLELSGIPTSFKPPPVPYFLCEYCQKISDTCYFCLNQTSNFERKLYQFQLYNEPNNLPIEEVVKHCDKSFIYEENIDNADKIYEPYITRCKVEDEYDVEGKRKKKDHPGFCKYCIIEGAQWDSNFYERNNSRYRGHMINTHGIHPNGTRCKLPETGVFCYKWIRNHWFETSGFFCPYIGCNEPLTLGEKSHGFHEYLRHWSKCHADG